MARNVADLKIEELDAMDDVIRAFYGRRAPEYAVYRTDQRVMVHFADNDKRAAEQRRAMARLNPLRGEINGLIDGWRTEQAGSALKRRAERYDRRVGDALVVAFEGDIDGAETLLTAIKQDVRAERVARGRVEYLAAALATGIGALLLIALLTRLRNDYPDLAIDLWRAAAAGAVGAFFSIAMAMRNRTVLPDLERTANIMDAIQRMTIGVIAAAVLMALMHARVVRLQLGDNPIDAELGWLAVLIIGFIAGFSERFVPDLLARASASTERQPAAAAEPAAARTDRAAQTADQASAAAQAAAEEPDEEEDDPLPHEQATDACASDLDLPDELVTDDIDLPAAAGGVATPERPQQGS